MQFIVMYAKEKHQILTFEKLEPDHILHLLRNDSKSWKNIHYDRYKLLCSGSLVLESLINDLWLF